MKKRYVIEIEYDESAKDVTGTFGIADPKWQERIGKALRASETDSMSENLITMLDEGKISTAELMGLAVGGCSIVYRRSL